MANIVTLTDGTTTLSINAGLYAVTGFRMGAPGAGEETATDSLDVLVSGASLSAVTDNVRALERMLEAAKRRQVWQAGPRVYLTVQWDGQSDAWRAEIVDGILDADETAGQLWRRAAEVTLAITRRPFEGAWIQLSLTNGNGTNVTTAGLHVFNVYDSTGTTPNVRQNYALVDAAEVTGSLPAPVKIELKNDTGGAVGWDQWWLGADSHSNVVLTHRIEGESRVTGYGTVTASGSASGGNYNAQTVNGTLQTHWAITAAQARAMGGQSFRLIAVFAGDPPNAFVTPAIYDETGLVELGAGDEVQLTSSMTDIVDLGALSIPPGDAATAFAPVRLVLKWRSSASTNINIDFLHLFPGYATRQMAQRGLQVGSAQSVILDESEDRAWFTNGADEYPVFVLRGVPLTILPSKAARLMVLAGRQSTGSYVAADDWLVQAWFRPRRWTV